MIELNVELLEEKLQVDIFDKLKIKWMKLAYRECFK